MGRAFNFLYYRARALSLKRAVLRNAIDLRGKSIIEVGFGAGTDLSLWRAMGAGFVMGVDVSQEAVKAAAARFESYGWRFEAHDISRTTLDGTSKVASTSLPAWRY